MKKNLASLFLIGLLSIEEVKIIEKDFLINNQIYTISIYEYEYKKDKITPKEPVNTSEYNPNLIADYNLYFQTSYPIKIKKYIHENRTLENIIKTINKNETDNIKKTKNILDFVHNIKYKAHEKISYTKFPIETIIDGEGNCEDMTVLAYSLLKIAKIDTVMTLLTPKSTEEYHILVGVQGNYEGKFVTHNNEKYYLTETTRPFEIGKIVSEWEDRKTISFKI